MAVTGPAEIIHYYTGLSSDVKPTTDVPPRSEFVETDTGRTYLYSDSAWGEEKEEV